MSMSLQRYREFLVTYFVPLWPRVALLAALLGSSIGLGLLAPQLVRQFIDAAQAGAAVATLTITVLLFLAVGVGHHIAVTAAAYLSADVGWRATNQLRSDLALHCLRLDMRFHNEHTPGELIERIDGDVGQLANFLSEFVVDLLGSALFLIGVLALVWREDWRAGLAFTLFAALSLVVLRQVFTLGVGPQQRTRQAQADVAGFLEERLAGTEDIRSSGATPYVLRHLYQTLRVAMQRTRLSQIIARLGHRTSWMLFAFGNAMALGVGAYLFSADVITLGTVYLFVHYLESVWGPLNDTAGQLEDLQRATASLGRIDELLNLKSGTRDGPGASLPPGPLPVTFQDVSFGYRAATPVLRDISFQLAPGTVLGLLGRTGSGKTTLTRLLFRLFDPNAGTIRLGDTDLRDTRLVELRQRIGLVTQEVQLFHATVRDNLAFFDPSIPDDRIVAVLDEVGLTRWYQSLPAGLDTELAAGGSGLSAGEAQLLAFARVFLRDPGLVMLDEASSRLDPATEGLLERAVDRLLWGRTAIVIAHRLATVERADEIALLEAGHIVEQGIRVVLASDPTSRFSQLRRSGLAEVLA